MVICSILAILFYRGGTNINYYITYLKDEYCR